MYIAAIKEACSILPRGADELRADTSQLHKNHCPHNKFNTSKVEHRAIKELREDQTRDILTTDKGVAMVKQEYSDKTLTLLRDNSTYNTINKDPTTRLRNTLSTTLEYIKQKGGLSDITYRKVPNQCFPSQVLWPSKNPQNWPPLRPIIYGVAKELAGIIRPSVGQSPHHLKNTQHFVQHIQKATLELGEVMASYDVGLFHFCSC